MRAACWVVTVVVLACVTSASAASQRRVTIDLSGRGKAFWKLDGKSETAFLALRYRWYGTIAFDAPSRGPMSVTRSATLTAGWSGTYRDNVSGVESTCTYGGAHVHAAVTATLASGRRTNTLELILHPRTGGGFFAAAGHQCAEGTGPVAPPHFSPASFFRDNVEDHGRLTSDTAILFLPAKLLPHGKATLAFPFERGKNDSVAVGDLGWDNRGTATVRVR